MVEIARPQTEIAEVQVTAQEIYLFRTLVLVRRVTHSRFQFTEQDRITASLLQREQLDPSAPHRKLFPTSGIISAMENKGRNRGGRAFQRWTLSTLALGAS